MGNAKHKISSNKDKIIACVTGASGMIGNSIVKNLKAAGYQVRALSRRSDYHPEAVEVFRGDLRDGRLVEKFLQRAALLFHCAAELRDAARMWEVNVQGTEVLLELARQAGVQYFCHLSSAGVVGLTDRLWVEETSRCNPINPYERSKWQAEQLVARQGQFPGVVILRPTNVIDEERPGAFAPAMRGSWRDRLKVLVKGGECAHIIHADDVAAAALFLLSHPSNTPQCFFVSCDHEPLNTFAGLWTLYWAYRNGRPVDQVAPAFHLPLVVPQVWRRIRQGRRNRGDVRYSAAKLLATGFTFPLGVYGAARRIAARSGAGQS